MRIQIDGKQVNISESDRNIVDAAKRAGIGIPAPCYYSERKNGCCKACVIEIDGKKAYACGTRPVDGMNIAFRRMDLDFIRKERMAAYRESQKTGTDCGCDCSETANCC